MNLKYMYVYNNINILNTGSMTEICIYPSYVYISVYIAIGYFYMNYCVIIEMISLFKRSVIL